MLAYLETEKTVLPAKRAQNNSRPSHCFANI